MIQIDEMKIRVPGLQEEEGARLGRQVAERVASALPDDFGDRRIPEINVQLRSVSSNDSTLLADRIAEQIIRQINLAMF